MRRQLHLAHDYNFAKKITISLVILIAIPIIIIGGYVLFLQLNYYRIDDFQELCIINQQKNTIEIGKEYTAMTYNIGFGAYDHGFSFFMDKGLMKNGAKVQGKYGKAKDEGTILKNTYGSANIIEKYSPDFCILQEVDSASTRSYFVNQKQIIESKFTNYANIFGNNFHSVYLCYPISDPHGSVQAGLLTLSRHKISKATRRSYPVDESFITKFFDLDRCFVITRISTNNNKELILINSHMSAYDEGGIIRRQQIDMLKQVLADEYEKGNYVIVGGDFNHALCGTLDIFDSQQEIPEWVSVMNDEDIPEHFKIVEAKNLTEVPTCRSTDIPYTKGTNYMAVLDGFIVSDNIEAEAENIDTDFMFSDHNPVMMKFTLK